MKQQQQNTTCLRDDAMCGREAKNRDAAEVGLRQRRRRTEEAAAAWGNTNCCICMYNMACVFVCVCDHAPRRVCMRFAAKSLCSFAACMPRARALVIAHRTQTHSRASRADTGKISHERLVRATRTKTQHTQTHTLGYGY